MPLEKKNKGRKKEEEACAVYKDGGREQIGEGGPRYLGGRLPDTGGVS